MISKYLGYQREIFILMSNIKVLHKYEVVLIMGVGGVILPMSIVFMINFHELSCSKSMPIIFR